MIIDHESTLNCGWYKAIIAFYKTKKRDSSISGGLYDAKNIHKKAR
jgi:hypothetical protein